MSADYLISSLPGLTFDGEAPITMEYFLSNVHSQLSRCDAQGVEDVINGNPSSHPIAVKWSDIDTQIRNAIAAQRAKQMEKDPSKWLRPAEGCSLYWKDRIVSAFNEKDPTSRQRQIDLARFEAAGELTPVTSPLSTAAVFTYAIRLEITLRRSSMNIDQGNNVFDKLTAVSSPESLFKEEEQ